MVHIEEYHEEEELTATQQKQQQQTQPIRQTTNIELHADGTATTQQTGGHSATTDETGLDESEANSVQVDSATSAQTTTPKPIVPKVLTFQYVQQQCKASKKLYDTPTLNDSLELVHQALTDVSVLSAEMSHLIALHLDYNNLTSQSVLSGLSSLHSLKSLFLAHNNLSDDLTCLAQCTALCVLDVSNNHITSLEGIQQLTSLQTLDISHNQLQTLEPLTSQPTTALTTLNASNNLLSDIDNTVTALKSISNLRTLLLKGNAKLVSNTYRRQIIHACPQLRYFDERPVEGIDHTATTAYMQAKASSDESNPTQVEAQVRQQHSLQKQQDEDRSVEQWKAQRRQSRSEERVFVEYSTDRQEEAAPVAAVAVEEAAPEEPPMSPIHVEPLSPQPVVSYEVPLISEVPQPTELQTLLQEIEAQPQSDSSEQAEAEFNVLLSRPATAVARAQDEDEHDDVPDAANATAELSITAPAVDTASDEDDDLDDVPVFGFDAATRHLLQQSLPGDLASPSKQHHSHCKVQSPLSMQPKHASPAARRSAWTEKAEVEEKTNSHIDPFSSIDSLTSYLQHYQSLEPNNPSISLLIQALNDAQSHEQTSSATIVNAQHLHSTDSVDAAQTSSSDE